MVGKFKKGHTPWNKGLTKDNDKRVKKYADNKIGKKRSDKFCQKMKDMDRSYLKEYWTNEKRKECSEKMKILWENKNYREKLLEKRNKIMKSKEYRKNMSVILKEEYRTGKRILWNKGTKGICKAWNKGLTKDNNKIIKTISINRKENFKSGKLKKYKRTEKVINKLSMCMKNGGAVKARLGNVKISYPQRMLYLKILNQYPEAILEYPIKTKKGTKFIDIAIPSERIAIEYDGLYWHQNEEKDAIREQAIIDEGWIVVRFNKYNVEELWEVI